MKILITGAKGMLGKDISEILSNHDLILLDKEELDLTDFTKTEEEITKLHPELIINCAAFTDVDKAEESPEIANLINGEVPGNLAKICKKLSIILLQISTEYVFDGKDINGYSEDAITSAINEYGKSKALGEKLIQENCKMYYIVRSSWLYGHNLQRGKERGINFVDRIIELAGERDELNMVNDQFSKPTFTKDLANGIKTLIEEKYPCGIYHMTNEDATVPYEFANEIFKIKGINTKTSPISYSAYPSKVERPINAILVNTKFPKLRSWHEAIKEYLK
ncbi:MAG: dTDP-4-dehydrorhamnose reductase [Patescibacteria group bacterium]|nr:dTDP-4-dehydrorhamnose reductase [Patescibacteria group bacterium]MDD4304302.1 dTDP-4-dehydrorhamnose reductase [Patescibacteria group bacterium]MDD4695671.1 dTDP-4-dehydrorhamnose reductase [Patescibacteria group bacterium]